MEDTGIYTVAVLTRFIVGLSIGMLWWEYQAKEKKKKRKKKKAHAKAREAFF